MFALILSLCIDATSCNDYVIDSSSDLESDCHTALVAQSDSFAVAWNADMSNKLLTEWLARFHIVEPIERVTQYDFTCPFIADADIP